MGVLRPGHLRVLRFSGRHPPPVAPVARPPPPASRRAPSGVSQATPQSSLPHRLVPVVSGVDVGVEVTPVEDTAASSRRPRPSSPPGFPVVPQFSPRSPLWPVTAELGGAPTGGTGGPGGVASGGASSGSVGAGGTGTVAPTPCTVRFLARREKNRIHGPQLNRFSRSYVDEGGNSTTSTGSLDITPDDILVYSKNMKEHVEQLRKVFEILRKNKFYVKLSKSDFALKKVQFLGHMVSAEGVHVDPRKIEAVKKWKVPENVKELQQFIGFAKYYNRFVPQYAKIAAPLTDLLKKDTPFKWDTPHQQAMEQLQTALTTAPVLILPDPEKDYVVEADASDQAVGAVLMQDHGRGLQPIAYLSKKLHGAELNYPIHDKEALAIVVAFKAWRCYLEGAKTTVYTDHCSLKYLKSQPTLSRRQVRWMDFLETHFHYNIVYKPGLHNKADALSHPGHVAGIQLDGMNPLLKGLFQHGRGSRESEEAGWLWLVTPSISSPSPSSSPPHCCRSSRGGKERRGGGTAAGWSHTRHPSATPPAPPHPHTLPPSGSCSSGNERRRRGREAHYPTLQHPPPPYPPPQGCRETKEEGVGRKKAAERLHRVGAGAGTWRFKTPSQAPGAVPRRLKGTVAHAMGRTTSKAPSRATGRTTGKFKFRAPSCASGRTTSRAPSRAMGSMTGNFELELLQQNAQIYHYFDGSYAGPSEETDDAKNKYYNESLMAYGVLLRNMSLTEQLSIRSYKTSPAPALNAWRHLNGAYQPKDSVSSSRLLQQLLETKMAPGEKANSYLNRCRSLRDQIAKLGSTISEEIFMNIVLQGLGPEWRLCKVLLQQQRVISEAALYAALLIEQRDMDQQQPAPHRDKEHLAFYADSTEERQPQRLCCKICRNFGHLADRCKHRSRPHQTNPSNWSGQQDARNDTLPAQGHQPPSRSLNLTVQRQQQPSQAAPVRSVMGNMIMTSGSRRPRARSPSPEPAPDPIGAFSNNNPFSTRQDYSDDDKQDWNLPVSLLESPPHVPNIRPAPINWIARKQFLKVDTPYIVTPRLALLARNDNRRYNTWYLDSCWGQHMVGSERYISNVVATPAVTYVTVANNTRLRASAQGIVVLKAHGSRTHITLNDVLIVQNLCLNLLSAALLLDCRVILSTDPETCDILLHFTMPNKMHKQIGWAHAENGVYVLNFDIPDCSGDSQELIDLVPLCFEHIHRRDWKHPDGHPWVPHHPHPRELALHDPDPDGVCTTRVVFGIPENPLPGSASQHLQGMLRSVAVGTFDTHGNPRSYSEGKAAEIHSHRRNSKLKLLPAEEEALAQRKAEELRRKSLTEARGTLAWEHDEESASNEGGLIDYVDADHATNPNNRQSRTGFLFRLEPSGPISWNSQKQELVALSSAEAEFIAATAAVHEGLYLQELLQEAKIPATTNFRLHCDNQRAIMIANKSGFIYCTKHIALRYFFAKDEVDKGKVDLTYCPTGDMAADFLTKKLPRQQYQHCSELSGVVKRVKTRYG
ncbi:unnamed protein product [Closterium sp. NIES-53]